MVTVFSVQREHKKHKKIRLDGGGDLKLPSPFFIRRVNG